MSSVTRWRWQTAIRWRRALRIFGLLVVALSVVGMHQLSLDHTLVTTKQAGGAPVALDSNGTQHAGSGHQLAGVAARTITSDAPAVTVAVSSTAALQATEDSGAPAFTAAAGCADCHEHTMLLMACLLALTLLMLPWLHQPPRARLVPLFLRPPRPAPIRSLGRRRPPLSLVELSLRRT